MFALFMLGNNSHVRALVIMNVCLSSSFCYKTIMDTVNGDFVWVKHVFSYFGIISFSTSFNMTSIIMIGRAVHGAVHKENQTELNQTYSNGSLNRTELFLPFIQTKLNCFNSSVRSSTKPNC